MSKKSFEPYNCIAPLNNLKKGLLMTGKPFTGELLRKGIKGCGLPSNSNFFVVFKASGIVKEVSRGKYVFADDKPIYVGVLSSIKHKYSELCRKYNNARVKENAVEKETVNPNLESQIQSAINLLKGQGYQIFVPIDVIYRKL